MMNEDFKDALGELINIAFGSSTAIIADLFDNFATLRVPDILVIPISEIEPYVLNGMEYQDVYMTTQQFKGALEGEIVFAIDGQSAQNMQNLICVGENLDICDQLDETQIEQSVLEIANILGSSCIGKFVELLNTDVLFEPPGIEFTHELLKGLENTRYSKIIVISTVLEFKAAQISGRLFILYSDEMYDMLKERLEAFWGEM